MKDNWWGGVYVTVFNRQLDSHSKWYGEQVLNLLPYTCILLRAMGSDCKGGHSGVLTIG